MSLHQLADTVIVFRTLTGQVDSSLLGTPRAKTNAV